MNRIAAAALVLLVFSLAPSAGAQIAPLTPITVDEVAITDSAVVVFGVPQGGTTSSTLRYTPAPGLTEAKKSELLDRCHRAMLLALAKPGQYVARIGLDPRVGVSVCSVALSAP